LRCVSEDCRHDGIASEGSNSRRRRRRRLLRDEACLIKRAFATCVRIDGNARRPNTLARERLHIAVTRPTRSCRDSLRDVVAETLGEDLDEAFLDECLELRLTDLHEA